MYESFRKNQDLNGLSAVEVIDAKFTPAARRKKRETGDVTVTTTTSCTGSCNASDVDSAVDNTDGVSADSPATST